MLTAPGRYIGYNTTAPTNMSLIYAAPSCRPTNSDVRYEKVRGALPAWGLKEFRVFEGFF